MENVEKVVSSPEISDDEFDVAELLEKQAQAVRAKSALKKEKRLKTESDLANMIDRYGKEKAEWEAKIKELSVPKVVEKVAEKAVEKVEKKATPPPPTPAVNLTKEARVNRYKSVVFGK